VLALVDRGRARLRLISEPVDPEDGGTSSRRGKLVGRPGPRGICTSIGPFLENAGSGPRHDSGTTRAESCPRTAEVGPAGRAGRPQPNSIFWWAAVLFINYVDRGPPCTEVAAWCRGESALGKLHSRWNACFRPSPGTYTLSQIFPSAGSAERYGTIENYFSRPASTYGHRHQSWSDPRTPSPCCWCWRGCCFGLGDERPASRVPAKDTGGRISLPAKAWVGQRDTVRDGIFCPDP